MKNLANFKEVRLSRTEMQEVKGGVKSTFHCCCFNNPGEWYGNYSSTDDMIDAVNTYCPNGGTCESVPPMEL